MRTRVCASNPRTDGAPWEPWEGNGPCQDCGARNVVWRTDARTWRAVMGDEAGLLCPSCFAVRAHAAGVASVWRLVPDWPYDTPVGELPHPPAWLVAASAAGIALCGTFGLCVLVRDLLS